MVVVVPRKRTSGSPRWIIRVRIDGDEALFLVFVFFLFSSLAGDGLPSRDPERGRSPD